MQMNSGPRHKFLLLGIAFCMAMLASGHDARALGIGDSQELGFLWPGVQGKTDNQKKVNYVNHLIGMAVGTIDVANGEVYSRSNHGFESLPAAARTLSGGGRGVKIFSHPLLYYNFFSTSKRSATRGLSTWQLIRDSL